jgi:DNA-binding NarL/FixJ family response regulator
LSVNSRPRVLVVDDTPQNVRVLEAVLAPRGYEVLVASSGAEALDKVTAIGADLVLLDVVMPGMDGYEVCRRLRADAATAFLPVVMITASGDHERLQAVEAGADDFVQKPFNQAELLARIRSLLRIKSYHDTIQAQAAELTKWNHMLEARVQTQVAELERLGRLRRFLPTRVAELLVSAEGESLLESHRQQIAVVACRLLGFAELSETSAPEEVLAVLAEYHASVSAAVSSTEATIASLNADELLIVLNDPLPVDDPAGEAVRLALDVRDRLAEQTASWRRRGCELGFGVGIDLGYATLGILGMEGRTEYGAIGPVVHVATRLRDIAHDAQIVISQRAHVAVEDRVDSVSLGQQTLPGLARPVYAFALERLRADAILKAAPDPETTGGPLTAREREVASLIARGCSNREIADALVVADATAVRHVANILNKLGMSSRAQVAVWAVQQGLVPR